MFPCQRHTFVDAGQLLPTAAYSCGPPHLPTAPQGARGCRLLVVVDGNTVGVPVRHPALFILVPCCPKPWLQQLRGAIYHVCAAAGEGARTLSRQHLHSLNSDRPQTTRTRTPSTAREPPGLTSRKARQPGQRGREASSLTEVPTPVLSLLQTACDACCGRRCVPHASPQTCQGSRAARVAGRSGSAGGRCSAAPAGWWAGCSRRWL